jgi:lipopolysaccharide export system permease protein
VAGLQAGRFYVEDEGKLVVYIGAIGPEKGLERVFILDRRDDVQRVVVSEGGRHRLDDSTGDHLVSLLNGYRFDGSPGQANYMVGKFEEYQIRLRSSGDSQRAVNKRSAASTSSLLDSDDIADRTELEHRIAAPLAILALTIAAVPLVSISPRQRTSGRMLLAFIAYFAFFNLQRLAEIWMASGATPPWLTSLWYQALIVALIYVALLPESFWYRRLLARLKQLGASPERAPT